MRYQTERERGLRVGKFLLSYYIIVYKINKELRTTLFPSHEASLPREELLLQEFSILII